MTAKTGTPMTLAQMFAASGVSALPKSNASDADLASLANRIEAERESDREPRRVGRPTKVEPRKRTAVKGLRLEVDTWEDIQTVADALMKSVNRCIEEAVFAYLCTKVGTTGLPEIASANEQWGFAPPSQDYPQSNAMRTISFELGKVG